MNATHSESDSNDLATIFNSEEVLQVMNDLLNTIERREEVTPIGRYLIQNSLTNDTMKNDITKFLIKKALSHSFTHGVFRTNGIDNVEEMHLVNPNEQFSEYCHASCLDVDVNEKENNSEDLFEDKASEDFSNIESTSLNVDVLQCDTTVCEENNEKETESQTFCHSTGLCVGVSKEFPDCFVTKVKKVPKLFYSKAEFENQESTSDRDTLRALEKKKIESKPWNERERMDSSVAQEFVEKNDLLDSGNGNSDKTPRKYCNTEGLLDKSGISDYNKKEREADKTIKFAVEKGLEFGMNIESKLYPSCFSGESEMIECQVRKENGIGDSEKYPREEGNEFAIDCVTEKWNRSQITASGHNENSKEMEKKVLSNHVSILCADKSFKSTSEIEKDGEISLMHSPKTSENGYIKTQTSEIHQRGFYEKVKDLKEGISVVVFKECKNQSCKDEYCERNQDKILHERENEIFSNQIEGGIDEVDTSKTNAYALVMENAITAAHDSGICTKKLIQGPHVHDYLENENEIQGKQHTTEAIFVPETINIKESHSSQKENIPQSNFGVEDIAVESAPLFGGIASIFEACPSKRSSSDTVSDIESQESLGFVTALEFHSSQSSETEDVEKDVSAMESVGDSKNVDFVKEIKLSKSNPPAEVDFENKEDQSVPLDLSHTLDAASGEEQSMYEDKDNCQKHRWCETCLDRKGDEILNNKSRLSSLSQEPDSSYFKWKYTPSYEIEAFVHIPENNKDRERLPQLTPLPLGYKKSLKIGLSKKQKTISLHPYYKQ